MRAIQRVGPTSRLIPHWLNQFSEVRLETIEFRGKMLVVNVSNRTNRCRTTIESRNCPGHPTPEPREALQEIAHGGGGSFEPSDQGARPVEQHPE